MASGACAAPQPGALAAFDVIRGTAPRCQLSWLSIGLISSRASVNDHYLAVDQSTVTLHLQGNSTSYCIFCPSISLLCYRIYMYIPIYI